MGSRREAEQSSVEWRNFKYAIVILLCDFLSGFDHVAISRNYSMNMNRLFANMFSQKNAKTQKMLFAKNENMTFRKYVFANVTMLVSMQI
jgi:hypothetical protein